MTVIYSEAELRVLLQAKAQQVANAAEHGKAAELVLLAASVEALANSLPRHRT